MEQLEEQSGRGAATVRRGIRRCMRARMTVGHKPYCAAVDGPIDLGFETIGNATVVVHDHGPVLATDPWIEGSAYFGSWGLSHPVPPAQMASVLDTGTIWFSH